jgi:hypothetical protein
MPVEPELDTVVLCIVVVVAVLLSPDNVEAPTRTRPEASVDGYAQFGSWVEAAIETVVADQRFVLDDDVTYHDECLVIDGTRIAL